MAKFCGIIGFVKSVETVTGSGKYKNEKNERRYQGDLLRNNVQIVPSEYVNDDITFNNDISILADPYAVNHFMDIKYVIFLGQRWKVKSVEVKYPRLVLKIGGIYNGV